MKTNEQKPSGGPLPLWCVEEEKHQRWSFTVRAISPAHARQLAREWAGFHEPSTVTLVTP
jgi:hypothetical protein